MTVDLVNSTVEIADGVLKNTTINVKQVSVCRPFLSNPVSVATAQWGVMLIMNDDRNEEILLSKITNQPTWTNDASGAITAAEDIMGAIPLNCVGTWPSTPYEGNGNIAITWGQQQASYEAGPPALGFEALIAWNTQFQEGPQWHEHTGEIAVYVGPGNGLAGSAWTYTDLPAGTIVNPALGSGEFWMIVNEVSTSVYTSGKFAISVLDTYRDSVNTDPIVLPITDQFNGAESDRASYLDPCRTGIMQGSSDFSIWNDIGDSFTEAEAFLGVPRPADWNNYGYFVWRVEWRRASGIQGASSPIF